jgi:magnesium-transporting ATPase (P-type)
MPQLAVAVWLVNLLNGAFFGRNSGEKAFEALRRLLGLDSRRSRRRGGRSRPADVVPGDVLVLRRGRVPADARVVEDIELRLDESVLTGIAAGPQDLGRGLREEAPVVESANLVFGGTRSRRAPGKRSSGRREAGPSSAR